MSNSCAKPELARNCDANDNKWRENSGLLADKTHLPVKQLRFGDTEERNEESHQTLGKFKCYGITDIAKNAFSYTLPFCLNQSRKAPSTGQNFL